MHKDDFRLPIRIVERPGEPVREIYRAGEALDFLLAWPRQDGAVYRRAVDSCFAVTVEIEGPEKAQQAFRNFARLSGILSKDMAPSPRRGRFPQAVIG